MDIGTIFDDYIVTDFVPKKGYVVKCQICGHAKINKLSNLKKQDNHHSMYNCKEDFYGTDLLGKIYGDYECIECTNINKKFVLTLKCKICGHIKHLLNSELRDMNHSILQCDWDFPKNIVGQLYGDYKVISYDESAETAYKAKYECECVFCHTKANVTFHTLDSSQMKHGDYCMTNVPDSEYKTVIASRFYNMKQRCCNPNNTNYPHYGGRGIKLKYEHAVDLYYDFIDELVEHSKTHSLRDSTFDRIDVNGDYEKDNLRITTQSVQSTNTTRKKYFVITNGTETILSDSAMEVGRYLSVNGRAIGNLIRGCSKSSYGWTLVCVSEDEDIDLEKLAKAKDVTTKIITT